MAEQNQLAVRRKSFLDVIQGQGFKAQLALALPKHVTADRLLRICLTQMNRIPRLYECTQDSVLAGLMRASQLGLEIDGEKAALVPFKDNRNDCYIATLIIGYQGFIELAYRHPKVTGIRAKAVHAKDHFDYDEGLHPKLEHKPYDGDDDPGVLRYAYAICNIEGGGAAFVVLNKRQVMQARNYSRGADKPDSPWRTNEEAMWMKTAVRRLAPFMPKSSELSEALSVDTEGQGALDIASTVMQSGTVGSTTEEPAKSITELAQQEQASSETKQEGKAEEKKVEKLPAPAKLIKEIVAKGAEINAGKGKIIATLVELKELEEGKTLEDMDSVALQNVIAQWETIKDRIQNPK